MENKRRFIICCCIVAAVLTFIVSICLIENTDEPKLLENAEAVYQEAANRVNGQENIRLNIFYDKSITIGTQIFRESSTQTIDYLGLGTDAFQGYTQQTLHIGNYTIDLIEIYNAGTGYFTVNGRAFCGALTDEDYIARYLPALPISPENYGEIYGSSTKKETVIHFSQASIAESWATEENMENITAEGTAKLDKNGNLKQTMYLLSYTSGEKKITLTATVEIAEAKPVSLLEDTESYTPISYLDGPRDLEVACGQLLMANCTVAAYNDTISCEAFGDIRKQSIDIKVCNAESWSAAVDTLVTTQNSGKVGVTASTQKTERFENGAYTAQIDANDPTQADISAKDMQDYCHDILVATIMLPDNITDAQYQQTDTGYRIVFTADESFAKMLQSEACTLLYQNADILTGLSESYKTDTVTCYLTVDGATGLPTGAGFHYDGVYTISALPYHLTYKADQSYDLLAEQ